jgi:hypothetical protein
MEQGEYEYMYINESENKETKKQQETTRRSLITSPELK